MNTQASSSTSSPSSIPVYQQIKDFVIQNIVDHTWTPGTQIPSETALCQQFNVSRMTVNKALRELANEGVVTRHQGAGTYVAEPKFQSTLVEIPNIVTEIKERGHQHSMKVISQERIKLSAKQAALMNLSTDIPLYYTSLVHLDNGKPVQFEERYVNANAIPQYIDQDWSKFTPQEYLMRIAPMPNGEYTIELRHPTAEIAKHLDLPASEPCLVMSRWAYANDNTRYTSSCVLWHPGQSYKFKGIF